MKHTMSGAQSVGIVSFLSRLRQQPGSVRPQSSARALFRFITTPQGSFHFVVGRFRVYNIRRYAIASIPYRYFLH